MVFILISCGIYFAIFSVGSSAIRPDPGWWCLTSKFLRAQSQVQGPGDGLSKETAEVEWRWKSLASRRSRSFNHLLIHSFNEFLLRTLMRPSVCENGKGNGIPLQYSCLDNPMDGGAWWAAVHGVTKSQTWLSNFTFTFHFHALEKEMATHSSVLAWRIPGMGSHRVGHYWSDLAVAAAVCEKLHRWTGRPGVLWFMGSQSRTPLSDWTELNTWRATGRPAVDFCPWESHRLSGSQIHKHCDHIVWWLQCKEMLRQSRDPHPAWGNQESRCSTEAESFSVVIYFAAQGLSCSCRIF